jgi:hypothetical protein
MTGRDIMNGTASAAASSNVTVIIDAMSALEGHA